METKIKKFCDDLVNDMIIDKYYTDNDFERAKIYALICIDKIVENNKSKDLDLAFYDKARLYILGSIKNRNKQTL